MHRQDTAMRRFNAWGWNRLVRITLDVRVRDLDCAFKVLRTAFLKANPPETSGALVNAELLYKLARSGATYREVGVTHMPRQGGRATGAKVRVIARALRDLTTHAYRWRRRQMPTPTQRATTTYHERMSTVRQNESSMQTGGFAMESSGRAAAPQLNLKRTFGIAAVAAILLGVLIAPAVWSAYPALANTAPDLPIAGLDSGGGPGGGPGGSTSQVTSWVTANCSTVDASAYGGQESGRSGATGNGGFGGPGGGGASTLYDCA